MDDSTVNLTIVEQTVTVQPQEIVVAVTEATTTVQVAPVAVSLAAAPTPELHAEITVAEPVIQVTQVTPSIAVTTAQPTVLVQGMPGPRGPQGEKGDKGESGAVTTTVGIPSGEELGGHRVVRATNGQAFYASCDQPSHAGSVVGLTTSATVPGESAQVVVAGDVVEPSWSWVDGDIYLGVHGVLTQTPPSSGFLQTIAVALGPTRVLMVLGDPIQR